MVAGAFFALVVLFASFGAAAQGMGLGLGLSDIRASGGAPLDTFTTPTGAYSFRKLKSTYAGSAVRLRRASDSAEQDIGFLGFVPGLGSPFDTAAANTFCAATSCFLRTWYDQSGNARDWVQVTAANQLAVVFNCVGTLPCLEMTAATQTALSASFTPATGIVSMNTVGRRTVGTGNCTLVRETGANRILTGTAGLWLLQANSATIQSGAAAELAWHSMTGIIASASSSIVRVDDVETSNAVGGTNVTASTMGVVGVGTATCQVTEGVVWDNYVLTAGERAALTSNQRSYFGF